MNVISDKPSLWRELQTRNLPRVAATYLVAGWMLVEASLTGFEEFGAPDWAARSLILLVVACFPLALLTAWLFQITPNGIRLTSSARRNPALDSESNAKRSRLAMWFGVLVPAALVGAIVGAVLLYFYLYQTEADTLDERIVAVLPLTNMSPDPENAFFAAGVHEEVLTSLSRVQGLKVISRTSVMPYGETKKGTRQIAAELGATHIVEGSIRRAGDNIRVTAQLIEVNSDQHLWAENFDRKLEDVFSVQSDIAYQIVSALDLQLTRNNETGTRNIAAYDRYIQAKALFRTAQPYPFAVEEESIQLLQEAVAIDPRYVDAWVLLAEWASRFGFRHPNHEDEYQPKALTAVKTLQQLAPNSVATLEAEAWYAYYVDENFDEALQLVERARVNAPTTEKLMELEAYLLTRLGRFDESITRLEEVAQLDPRNTSLLQQLRMKYIITGQYEKSYEYAKRRYEISPTTQSRVLIDFAKVLLEPNRTEMIRVSKLLGDSRFAAHVLMNQGLWEDAEKAWPKAVGADELELAIRNYHFARAHEWLGDDDKAREIAEHSLSLLKSYESRYGTADDRTIELIVRGYFGGYLDKPDVSEPAIKLIEKNLENSKDELVKMRWEFFLVETLVSNDLERARDLLLEAQQRSVQPFYPEVLFPKMQLWWPLLEYPEVRALFSPVQVEYLREVWPEARAFPFDGSAKITFRDSGI